MRTRRQHPQTEQLHFVRPETRTTIGSYNVIAQLGRGATGLVCLAEHTLTKERVAIKTLDPRHLGDREFTERLLAEHSLASRAGHPGLLEVRQTGFSMADGPYIVMEFLDGESLQTWLERMDPSTAQLSHLAAMIGYQIADAVAALHAGGVVHCDLKPANVFVLYEASMGGTPRVKVIDYGVARDITEPPANEGEISGTPAFMSPEQWNGAPTTKSDVYSLGCLLFELVTNTPLFSGTLPVLMYQHCEAMPDRPSARRPGISEPLERIIVRALSKDPAMRPSMSELADELWALCASPYPMPMSASA